MALTDRGWSGLTRLTPEHCCQPGVTAWQGTRCPRPFDTTPPTAQFLVGNPFGAAAMTAALATPIAAACLSPRGSMRRGQAFGSLACAGGKSAGTPIRANPTRVLSAAALHNSAMRLGGARISPQSRRGIGPLRAASDSEERGSWLLGLKSPPVAPTAFAVIASIACAAVIIHPEGDLVGACKEAWQWYLASTVTSPITTKACTSGVVYAFGDALAQRAEGTASVDAMRMARSSACGFLAHGPLSHYWYIFCDQHITIPGALGVGAKVLVDQTAWSAFWNSAYYLLLGVFKGEDLAGTVRSIKSTWLECLQAGWKLWPFAHIVTYGFVPQELRLLWVDGVEVVWVTILS
eukprot:CAMPEP_0182900328 /NCGR_PEP_ID=MMETSP0034_2-20130328/28758_1 /TAXON_ID=156128 /ORGANISM="Nephroselmis pyriformis, Strain CCMP717" /LENGTH=348 /DNA_ID=CAMNT_0025034525 /DNA_START=283 /DNA_END=1326 /DNA_ORIENTATION=+